MEKKRPRINRFFTLAPDERTAFIKASACLVLVGLGLRLLGLKRCFTLLHSLNLNLRNYVPARDQTRARHSTRMLHLAAKHVPFHGNCLTRALSLWWLLLRHGIEAQLRIGVRKSKGVLEAHAWVKIQNLELDELWDVEQLFSPFIGLHSELIADGGGLP
ncbi:MAG: lasso peptide biosynthesis B2 protein [Gammaproteobacteria bacterium]|nr:lasso peptide biosynthesis B2 protein [Gammaproteobacteria bacterium]